MLRPVEDALGARYGIVVITPAEPEDERWLIPFKTFTRESDARRWLNDPRFLADKNTEVRYEIVPVSLRGVNDDTPEEPKD